MCAIAGAVGLHVEPRAERADAILDAVAQFTEQSRLTA
jgi:hypothetical protein